VQVSEAGVMIVVDHFTIYHTTNAYIGTKLLREALAKLPLVRLMRG
jgi:hypothetical protein